MDREIIPAYGSTDIFAEFGKSGIFYRGVWQNIKVTGIDEGENMPLSVRRSLMGLVVPTIFIKERLDEQGLRIFVPNESRFAYLLDVTRVLESHEKYEAAKSLREVAHGSLDMCLFEGENYEMVT